jgi:hypothetical protein
VVAVRAWHNQLVARVQEQVRALVAPIDQNLVCLIAERVLDHWVLFVHQFAHNLELTYH